MRSALPLALMESDQWNQAATSRPLSSLSRTVARVLRTKPGTNQSWAATWAATSWSLFSLSLPWLLVPWPALKPIATLPNLIEAMPQMKEAPTRMFFATS